ncbi:hypothetical protein SDC9_137511 [bioreactor metagenome]|uniref:Uncharacterized protein n=1 Tax=bioreactor metagenome TaxID=1076179 RepID=A0A645DLR6_9ZZZZ
MERRNAQGRFRRNHGQPGNPGMGCGDRRRLSLHRQRIFFLQTYNKCHRSFSAAAWLRIIHAEFRWLCVAFRICDFYRSLSERPSRSWRYNVLECAGFLAPIFHIQNWRVFDPVIAQVRDNYRKSLFLLRLCCFLSAYLTIRTT